MVHIVTYLNGVDSTAGIHFSTAGGLRADAEPVRGAADAAGTPGNSRLGSVRVPPSAVAAGQRASTASCAGVCAGGKREPRLDLPDAARRF